MNIVQLNTGLFPDAQTVIAALRQTTSAHRVDIVDIRRQDLRESDWDGVIAALLAADLVVST
ncbi:MAG: hypothetical protein FD157_1097 [Rhodocyclaceae bacterium]|nr:MAG: hypothetical protein FD157_1097 [Rhodocyclaceae bacterium]TND06123.1 MAG: hypothetical protein FD118_195 [Rhodocyclaceae bacterium]